MLGAAALALAFAVSTVSAVPAAASVVLAPPAAIHTADTTAAIHTADPTGQYPYANAVCEFGTAGGPYCANPKDPQDDMYDWGYWHHGVFDTADQWGYEYRNCTSYVAWRLATTNVNARLFRDLGNAAQWLAAARGEAGVTINHTPSPGAVAVWESGIYGHVAWVDSVSHGIVTVSDYNYTGTGEYAQHTLAPADVPFAYIHFPQSASPRGGSGDTGNEGQTVPRVPNFVHPFTNNIWWMRALSQNAPYL